ncbi:MAG: ATP-binding cassette domain-containing protein [Chloroflexota bacterium]
MKSDTNQTYGLLAVLRRAVAAWRPHARLGVLIVAALLVQQLFQTFLAYSLKLIVDNVQSGQNDPPLALILAALLAGFVVAMAATFGGEYLTARAAGRLMGDVRRQLFAQLQALSVAYYVRMKLGDILSRFSGDLKLIEAGYTQAFLNTLLISLGLLVNVPVMLYLEWRLGLLALLSLPLILLANRRLMPGAAAATYDLNQTEGAVVNTVQEAIRAQLVVKAFGLQPTMAARFNDEIDHLTGVIVQSRFAIVLVGKVASMLILLIQILVTAVGALMAFHGTLSAGSLVAFLGILGVVSKDAYEFAKKVIPTLVQAGSGLRRLDEILQERPSVMDTAVPQPLPRLAQHIRFADVDFSYTGAQMNLAQINLTIGAGQSVAFVGPSGSGKSTTLSLILRLYDPLSGQVCFDDVDIRQVTQGALRAQMGTVFQDNYLFNTTIRENIRLSRPEASDAAVEAAAQAAEIHDLIISLPHGYDAQVGEAGGRLSGGQRQRIAIARAILRDPAILLLDEATSALDPGTEAAVNQTIARLGQGRTVIAVTHRLASVVQADQIFVMQNGRLVEQGTHQTLLAQGGLYHQLWQKQTGFEVSDDGRRARVGPRRLQQMHLFSNLSEEQLTAVADQFASEHYAAHEVIFNEGAAGDRFYMLVRGQVEVLANDKYGVARHLEVLEDGDHFGEMALLQNKPRNATIKTLTPCLVITLGREQFNNLVAYFPEMLPAIEQRVARSENNLAALQRQDPPDL